MDKYSHKGFTIIELMIAMGVLAFGILGFTFLNSRAISNRTFSRDLTQASNIAARVAENLIYLKHDNPLLNDDNSEDPAVTTKYPLVTANNGDEGTISGMSYTVSTKTYTNPQGASRTDKWFTIKIGNQNYYLRWEILNGNSTVVGSPDDNVKMISIFAAFEKKDPKTGSIILGGYNPARIGPTILTFRTDIES